MEGNRLPNLLPACNNYDGGPIGEDVISTRGHREWSVLEVHLEGATEASPDVAGNGTAPYRGDDRGRRHALWQAALP